VKVKPIEFAGKSDFSYVVIIILNYG
jgi:hypothetical protein